MFEFPILNNVGVVIDILETKFDTEYEVRFGHERGWFNLVELEVLSENGQKKK